jgi:glycosyltransferase involved in cell wall biosynthesis
MPKIRVLYIHQDGLITGSAISLRHFLSAINRDKFEPIVLLAQEGPARHLYEELGIEVVVQTFKRFWTFPGPNWYSPANFKQLKALWPDKQLAVFIKKINPAIIHINDKASINAGISLKGAGISIVQHSRSSYCITAAKINKWVSASAISNYADAVIAISEDEVDGHEGVKNLHVINNTVPSAQIADAISQKQDKRNELGLAEDDIVIGMVADISAKKGAWNFLEMAATMVKRYPEKPLKFLMVGRVAESGQTSLNDGKFSPLSPKQYVEQFMANHNLQGKLQLTGFRKDALTIMAGFDVLVVANHNGVMGRQPIEAQALGIPTVVTQGHSGKSTILKHDFAGYVLANPLKQSELLNAVEDLINHPEKRVAFGKNGQLYAAERFNPTINMGMIEKIYEELSQAN